jgi:Protein of unknown function (DUF2442)
MHSVREYKLVGDYRIWLKFEDGFESVVNLKPLLRKGIAFELLAPQAFSKVAIESGGGLAWENGFDICPNYLREMAGKKVIIS